MTDSMKLTGAAGKAIWDWIFNDGIRPHLPEIQRIVQDGRIAVVLFEVHPSSLDLAATLGYDGKRPVFPMDPGERRKFAQALRRHNDWVSVNWLEKKATNRIFAMVELGTFLINLGEDGTLTIEPGSLDGIEQDEEAVRKSIEEGLLR
jgi:hypothetical protein